jgi:hypothetical protein
MTAGERHEPGERTQGGGLPGTVGTQQGDDVTRGCTQCHVETERSAIDDEPGVEPVAPHAFAFYGQAGGGVVDVGHGLHIQELGGGAAVVAVRCGVAEGRRGRGRGGRMRSYE